MVGDFVGHPFRGNQYVSAFNASRKEHEYAADVTALHALMGMRHLGLKPQDASTTGRTGLAIAMKRLNAVYRMRLVDAPGPTVSRGDYKTRRK